MKKEPFKLVVNDEIVLKLRALSKAKTFFGLIDANRKHLRPWLSWVDKTKAATDTSLYLQQCIDEYYSGKSVDVGIRYRGEWVGAVSLLDISTVNQSAEIGYWLTKDAEKHGIMSRSVEALIKYAFEELKLNRLYIRCATENGPSKAVALHRGFTEEGVLRQAIWVNEAPQDIVVYALLKSEWRSLRA